MAHLIIDRATARQKIQYAIVNAPPSLRLCLCRCVMDIDVSWYEFSLSDR